MKTAFRITISLAVALFFASCAHAPKSTLSQSVPSKSKENAKEIILADNSEKIELEEGDELSDEEWDELEDEEDGYVLADPFYPINKIIWHFNDAVFYALLRPVSVVYSAVLPASFRQGIRNFFTNLTTPLRYVACLLQGKGEAAQAELVRFVVNSTTGFLGLVDTAAIWMPEFEKPSPEDLGQVLASWGAGHGFYLVLPFYGPSSLRDGLGFAGSYYLNPVSYVKPVETSYYIKIGEAVNDASISGKDYMMLKEAALDPYEAFKDAYIQYRQKLVEE